MSKINGIGIGVSYGNSSGSGNLIDSSTFFAPLKTSLILTRGTGGPTWSRATKAWGFNELGYLEELASGCAFFGGARLVRNLVPTPSNTLAVAGTKTVTLTQAATLQFSMGAGAGTATFSGTGGATGTLAAGASRVSVNKTVTAGTFIVTASVAELVDLSIVDVTNYDASYVPEYVSVGVLSSPYHGAGTTSTADGCKYFETDWQGAPIPAANLLGFRREAAATNNLLSSRNLTVQAITASTKRWDVSGTSGSELVTNGTFTADLTNWTPTAGAGGSITATGGICTFVSDGTGYTGITNDAALTVGKTYVGTVIASGTGSLKFVSTLEITGIGNGTSTFSFVATGTGITLARIAGVACNLAIDSISIKEAAVQCTRVTGLDGIANTATTLTAGAADAIILQQITLASAARCASAYVKRRTGTGTISFTQDGGSTWTDITSLINGSTWSRVQITSTLVDPSTGFKISTSGDAIDVDCVQNEAGSVATSPIVTTTATVTRNIDMLSYQSASNIDFTVGTAFAKFGSPSSAYIGYPVSCGNAGRILYGAVGPDQVRVYDGTTVISKATTDFINGGFVKAASAWSSGNSTQKLSVDGSAVVSGAFDGSMGSGAVINIASETSSAQPVYVGPVAIWNYQMTAAELQAITS